MKRCFVVILLSFILASCMNTNKHDCFYLETINNLQKENELLQLEIDISKYIITGLIEQLQIYKDREI
jgi:hypothetical protein